MAWHRNRNDSGIQFVGVDFLKKENDNRKAFILSFMEEAPSIHLHYFIVQRLLTLFKGKDHLTEIRLL